MCQAAHRCWPVYAADSPLVLAERNPWTGLSAGLDRASALADSIRSRRIQTSAGPAPRPSTTWVWWNDSLRLRHSRSPASQGWARQTDCRGDRSCSTVSEWSRWHPGAGSTSTPRQQRCRPRPTSGRSTRTGRSGSLSRRPRVWPDPPTDPRQAGHNGQPLGR